MDPVTIFAIITGSVRAASELYDFFCKVVGDVEGDGNLSKLDKQIVVRNRVDDEMAKRKIKCTGQEKNMLTEVTLTKLRRDKRGIG